MLKKDMFLAAMKAEAYRSRAFVVTAFSMIAEGPNDWKKDPYPYRIVQSKTGHFFVNPENVNELLPLEDADPMKSPFYHKDVIEFPMGSIGNQTADLRTTYGNLLFNYIVLIYSFGAKVEYLNGRENPGAIETRILPRLVDDVTPGSVTAPADNTTNTDPSTDDIYVSEYLKFADAMFYLTSFTQLFVPAGSEKSMTAPPGIEAFKQQLLEANKDRLNDPAVIAKIDAELVKVDAAYLKGDRSEGFLINDKSRSIVRKKLFLMQGGEVGITEKLSVDLIEGSLAQGWDPAKFPLMNNSLRLGSYNRGAQTMLGGESVKWLLRASSNISVTVEDCGSRIGNEVDLEEKNKKRYYGLNIVTTSGHEKATEESIGKYLGTKIMVRSPMYCVLTKTDYCATCAGERLSLNPTALSSAVADYGSAFLSMYMAAAHAKKLALAPMNYLTAIQ